MSLSQRVTGAAYEKIHAAGLVLMFQKILSVLNKKKYSIISVHSMGQTACKADLRPRVGTHTGLLP